MNAPSEPAVMMREHILSALKLTHSKLTISVEALRDRCVKKDDHAALRLFYDVLAQLDAERMVARCTGMRESKSFVDYWLTGIAHTPAPLKPLQPERMQIVPRNNESQPVIPYRGKTVKQKPNTSIPKLAKKAVDMAHKKSGKNAKPVRATLLRLIEQQPGIKRPALIKQAVAATEGTTVAKATKCLENLKQVSRLIRSEGSLQNLCYFLIDVSAPAITEPASAPAPAPVKKPSALEIAFSAPEKESPNGNVLNIAMIESGDIQISRAATAIFISKDDALRLYKFIQTVNYQFPKRR